MAYSKDAQKRYNDKSVKLGITYRPQERLEGLRVKAYCEKQGISVNAYLKALAKNHLDSIGFEYMEVSEE